MSENKLSRVLRARTVARAMIAVGATAGIAAAMGGFTATAGASGAHAASLTAKQLAAIPPIVRLPCSKNQGLKGKVVGVSWAEEIGLVDQLNNAITKFAKLSNCGLTIKIVNSNGNNSQQVIQDEQLIAQHVDLLFEQPAVSGGFDAVIAAAKKANIPVMNWSSVGITGATMNVNVSQAATGALDAAPTCDWIKAKQGGSAEVAMIVSPTDVGFKQRAAAFQAKLKKLCPGADFVATAQGGYTTPTAAESTALSLIQAHPDLKVIFADWDADTLGAATAAKDAGKTDPNQLFIAGCDGTAAQLALMGQPNSVLQATGAPLFNYDPGIIVNNIEQMLMGRKLPPTRVLVPRLVTPSNLTAFNALSTNAYSPKNASVFDTITQYFSKPETTALPIASGKPLKTKAIQG
jgi:simple sugar transport system substrate-binding protein